MTLDQNNIFGSLKMNYGLIWPLSDYYILKVVRACGMFKKKVVGLNPTWSNFIYEIAKLWLKLISYLSTNSDTHPWLT